MAGVGLTLAEQHLVGKDQQQGCVRAVAEGFFAGEVPDECHLNTPLGSVAHRIKVANAVWDIAFDHLHGAGLEKVGNIRRGEIYSQQ
mgnify:CR=1 FL=1